MCVTIPARLLSYVDDDRNYGIVEQSGVQKRINMTMLRGADQPEPGEYLLVHVGHAVSKVSDEEAQETMRFLEMLDGASDDLEAIEVPPAVGVP